MGHEDSRRERRIHYFLAITLPVTGLVIGLALLIFIPTVTEGVISIGWAIFFVSYSAVLIILDFFWFSDKVSKAYISWRVKRFGRRDYVERRKRYERQMERLNHHPELLPTYEKIFNRRFLLICLGLLEIFIFFIVAYASGEASPGGLVGIITFGVLFGVIFLVNLFLGAEETKQKKAKKLEREKRELERFKAKHDI